MTATRGCCAYKRFGDRACVKRSGPNVSIAKSVLKVAEDDFIKGIGLMRVHTSRNIRTEVDWLIVKFLFESFDFILR